MKYIAHRINAAEELKDVKEKYGVELDLRDDLNGNIYISHNPYEPGEDFAEYLKSYHHGTMILNVKSERIEHKILELMEENNLDDYFFLDSSFPMIYLLASSGMKKSAIRISEFEGMDTARNMKGQVEWIWVDCFTKIPIDKNDEKMLHDWGYKLCFVSPELQGRPEDIEEYAKFICENDIKFDAICTKVYNIPKWIDLGFAED